MLTLTAIDSYRMQGRNCFVIDMLDNNMPLLRAQIKEKLPLGTEVKVIHDGVTRSFKIKGIEMYAAGDMYEHKFISIMDDTVPITEYIEHDAGAYEDCIQVCRMCGEVLCDYTGAAWPEGDPAPRGFAEGTLYTSGTKFRTLYTNILPAEFFTVKKCTDK